MSNFDKFIAKAKTATQMAGKKANDILEVTKLNLEASELQNQIDDIFKEMGKIIYDAYKTEGVEDKLMQEKCEVIELKYSKIDDIKSKIGALKNVAICPKCSEKNSIDNAFCAKCGYKLAEKPSEESDQ
ncbi:hypothetical protein SDC9_167951 [bioreactor metagenome]|uniref:Uncharacterized protein n=1 Tax=bioreactor metagenome TaxID=1076179 RepID=A0A645G3Q0_9ZZZZ